MQRYLYYLRKSWWMVALSVITLGGLGFIMASNVSSPYKASTTLLVNAQMPVVDPVNPPAIGDELRLNQQLTQTYSQLLTTRPVLDDVARGLGISTDDLVDKISVTPLPDALLIQVQAKDDDAQRAADIANAVGRAFIAQSLVRPDIVRSGSVDVVEPAVAADSRGDPSVIVRTVLSAIAGLALGLVLVVARAYFDDTIWDPGQIVDRADGKSPTLLAIVPNGSVRANSLKGGARLPAINEAFRTLAVNTLGALGETTRKKRTNRRLLVVSANRNEGRTSIASRLAAALALEGRQVTLIDLDTHNPSIHRQFGVKNTTGVRDVLFDPVSANGAAAPREVGLEGVRVVTAGNSHPIRLAEMKGRDLAYALKHIEEEAKTSDLTILDTPPLHESLESIMLSGLVDGAIVVVQARRTTYEEVETAFAQLDAAGMPVVGYVLNRR